MVVLCILLVLHLIFHDLISWTISVLGNPVDNDSTLLDLNVNSDQSTIHLEVHSVDPVSVPLKLLNDAVLTSAKENNQSKMPDVLMVQIDSGNIYFDHI